MMSRGNGRENHSVNGGADALMSDQDESRGLQARLRAAGAAERERIERDIHDGAQQRLVALRVRLGLAAERHRQRGEESVSRELCEFERLAEEAIDDLRELAQGVYPSALAAQGLGFALRSASREAAQSVAVRCRVGRYSPEVESAVYFSCVEAIQNAAKHAGNTEVGVRIWETQGALHFSVNDSGAGFDISQSALGVGIRNMRDRLLAVDGTLIIDSAPHRGTRVEGTVPHP